MWQRTGLGGDGAVDAPRLLDINNVIKLLAQLHTRDEAERPAVGTSRTVRVGPGAQGKFLRVVVDLLLPRLHQRDGLWERERALARRKVDMREARHALVAHLRQVRPRVHRHLPPRYVGVRRQRAGHDDGSAVHGSRRNAEAERTRRSDQEARNECASRHYERVATLIAIFRVVEKIGDRAVKGTV